MVDDSNDAREGFPRLLRRDGFTADTCAHSDIAWDILARGGYDAAFIDAMMYGAPVGCRLIRRLRADPRTNPLLVFAMTGYTTDLLEDALLAGADRVVHKLSLPDIGIPEARRLCAAPHAPRVLVVEDEAGYAMCARQCLTRLMTEDIHMRVCPTAALAAFQVEHWRPDLILLDLHIDGPVGGQEFLKDLRLRHTARELPVIVTTAAVGTGLDCSCHDLGADDFLEKPFDADLFVSKVRAALRRRAPRAPTNWGPLTLDQGSKTFRLDARELDLSPLELKVLLELLEADGGLRTRDELMAKFWDRPAVEGYKSDYTPLRVLMSRLRVELGAHADLIETVPGLGFRLRRM